MSHEEHVQKAAGLLFKVPRAQRPASVGALCTWLQRKGACTVRMYSCVPPLRMVRALANLLGETKDPPLLQGEFAAVVAAAAAAAGDGEIIDPSDDSDINVINAAAAHTIQRLRKISVKDVSMSSAAQWLCSQAYADKSVDPIEIARELMSRGIISTEPPPAETTTVSLASCARLTYGDAEKTVWPRPNAISSRWKLHASSQRPWDAEAWLETLFASKRALAALSATAGRAVELNKFSVPGNRPFLCNQLKTLSERLQCHIRMVIKEQRIRIVRTRKQTLLSHAELSSAVSLVAGMRPAFQCEVHIPTAVARHVIGKGGRALKIIEAAHQVRLSLTERNEGLSLDGWLSAMAVPPVNADTRSTWLSALQARAESVSSKVSDDVTALLQKLSERSTKKGKAPGLSRTFSREYEAAKSEREHHRAQVAQKRAAYKSKLADKEQRQKKDHRVARDKGPAMRGGRRKAGENVSAEDVHE